MRRWGTRLPLATEPDRAAFARSNPTGRMASATQSETAEFGE